MKSENKTITFPVAGRELKYAVEEKQQTRIPLKDKTAGAAPVSRQNTEVRDTERCSRHQMPVWVRIPKIL